jgi:hypothetical protein
VPAIEIAPTGHIRIACVTTGRWSSPGLGFSTCTTSSSSSMSKTSGAAMTQSP